MHNYLTRDGIPPARFLELARADLGPYDVEFMHALVTECDCEPGGFAVRVRDVRRRFTSRVLLLATGVVDELPAVGNVREFYGLGVHHCPYCDGWEYRDRPLAAYGLGRQGLGLAMNLLTWSRDVTVVTNGAGLEAVDARRAAKLGIKVRRERIVRLLSRRGRKSASENDPLGRLRFESGPDQAVDAMFFNTDQMQRSRLPVKLGCQMNEDGGVIHDRRQRTGVKGLYLAGDASVDVQFVIVAAAEGAKAGMAMNRDLQERERRDPAGIRPGGA
jgi:thioredoxin reductase